MHPDDNFFTDEIEEGTVYQMVIEKICKFIIFPLLETFQRKFPKIIRIFPRDIFLPLVHTRAKKKILS